MGGRVGRIERIGKKGGRGIDRINWTSLRASCAGLKGIREGMGGASLIPFNPAQLARRPIL